MRILNIRFKNLNSLVGEWVIDLTHPAYTSDGIFAITGPTGAGKTTILDAICLALYGRTPRLNKVTKNGNEIMSQQTSECFAEVTFETQSGRFRCHWCQHRARKKPDGELQAPKHEIADANSGQIIEAKIRDVAKKIETTTGMDFDRFTRSMLLAQGGFAAFLQAAPDERAPILEQITGTEIYSQISIHVHEHRSDERKKLDTLQAALAGMQLLSEEDEQQLTESLDQKTSQEADLIKKVDQQRAAIAWLESIKSLEKELKLAKEQKQNWQMRQDAFQPKLKILQQANQALELAGEHAELISLRREQETDCQNHDKYRDALPSLETEGKRAEETFKLTSGNLEKKKLDQKDTSQIIRKTRELDLKLREKEVPIKTADDAITEQIKSLDMLRLKQDEDSKVLSHNNQALEDIRKHLTKTKIDEGLIEHLTGIRNHFETLKNLHTLQGAKLKEAKSAENQITETTQIWNDLAKNLEAQQRGLDVIQKTLDQKQLALKNILEDRELADWRNSLSTLKERKSFLEKIAEATQSLAESRRTLSELSGDHEALDTQRTNLSEQLQAQIEKHTTLEREMNLLETQLTLLNKIQAFEEARHQLQDDTPCPLCGAKEHPFAEGNAPAPDETTLALDTARTNLKAANDAITYLKVKQAEVIKDLARMSSLKKECTDRIVTSEALLNQNCVNLSIATSEQNLGEILPRLQKENADKLNSTARIAQDAEALEKEIGTLRESIENTKETVTQSERETQNATHNKNSAQQTLERIRKETKTLEAQHQNFQREVQQEVSAYGVEPLSTAVLDQVQRDLTDRRDQWVARNNEKSALKQNISVLTIQTSHQKEQIQKSAANLKQQQDLLCDLQRERDSLSHERHKLFGDKNPDDEETHLSTEVNAAEKDRDSSRQILNTATNEINTLKSRVEALEKSMTARTRQLKAAEDAFLARLNMSGFSDEANYEAARRSEDERTHLMQQAQQLITEQTTLTSKEQDKTTQLETERKKQVTEQPHEMLNQALNNFVTKHNNLQQEIGGIRQKLKDNDSLKQKQQEQTKTINAQKREYTRWDTLHELIGSADGKKYRNFAQGLTFEMMVRHANQQLQKMTDRYLLIRDESQPLELNVIDNYQAGEIRSTKNLSGGESFIISLSLALGLSHMASKNVRVDSLFLDEGFGTLDEDALDTALETLAGLQEDGKLIGVISHVPALKERISTQIQVSPHTGGRSVISGPGCDRLDQTRQLD